jgi:type IV pilus assembly protein PilQ
MSATWRGAPITEVLRAFAAFSGASIVAGAGVSGFVTADINDQPWDIALASILATQGLLATENASGIIRVENMADVGAREVIEPVVTRSYRISFSRAAELQAAIAPLLSPRGSVSVLESTNTIVVSDIERVQRAVAALLR